MEPLVSWDEFVGEAFALPGVGPRTTAAECEAIERAVLGAAAAPLDTDKSSQKAAFRAGKIPVLKQPDHCAVCLTDKWTCQLPGDRWSCQCGNLVIHEQSPWKQLDGSVHKQKPWTEEQRTQVAEALGTKLRGRCPHGLLLSAANICEGCNPASKELQHGDAMAAAVIKLNAAAPAWPTQHDPAMEGLSPDEFDAKYLTRYPKATECYCGGPAGHVPNGFHCRKGIE